MESEPLLVDKKFATKTLSISVRKLDYLITEGKLRTRKIGRRVLIPYSALRQFAKE
jgi:excisionase family DNA binding protein